MQKVDGDNSRLRKFRKLRQVVASAAMAGLAPIHPVSNETQDAQAGRIGAHKEQGRMVASWLAQKFPDMGIALAVSHEASLWQAIGQGYYGDESEPGWKAATVVAGVLRDFIMAAPADSVESAKARVTYWFRALLEDGMPVYDGAHIFVGRRIKADMTAIASGALTEPPADSRMGGWQYSSPYLGGLRNE